MNFGELIVGIKLAEIVVCGVARHSQRNIL